MVFSLFFALGDIDLRRLAGCSSLNELYEKSSCSLYLDNISVPLIFMNALDDPIIPIPLLGIAKKYAGIFKLYFTNFDVGVFNLFNHAETHDKSAFILSTHGGHLGFYEGGLIKPNCVTW